MHRKCALFTRTTRFLKNSELISHSAIQCDINENVICTAAVENTLRQQKREFARGFSVCVCRLLDSYVLTYVISSAVSMQQRKEVRANG